MQRGRRGSCTRARPRVRSLRAARWRPPPSRWHIDFRQPSGYGANQCPEELVKTWFQKKTQLIKGGVLKWGPLLNAETQTQQIWFLRRERLHRPSTRRQLHGRHRSRGATLVETLYRPATEMRSCSPPTPCCSSNVAYDSYLVVVCVCMHASRYAGFSLSRSFDLLLPPAARRVIHDDPISSFNRLSVTTTIQR